MNLRDGALEADRDGGLKERPPTTTGRGLSWLSAGPDRGKVAQDHGTTLSQPRSQRSTRSASAKRISRPTEVDSSEDEMDVLSGNYESPVKKAKKSKTDSPSEGDNDDDKEKDGFEENGAFHRYDPNFKPKRKLPNFKKIKANDAPVDDDQESRPQTRQTRSKGLEHSRVVRELPAQCSATPPDSAAPTAKTRPKPKPTFEHQSDSDKNQTTRKICAFPDIPPLSNTPASQSPPPRKRATFPVSPIRKHDDASDGAAKKPNGKPKGARGKGGKSTSQTKSKSKSKSTFPMPAPSPPSAPRKGKLAPFPMSNISPPAPSTSQHPRAFLSSHDTDELSSSGDELVMRKKKSPRRVRRPFPMSTQGMQRVSSGPDPNEDGVSSRRGTLSRGIGPRKGRKKDTTLSYASSDENSDDDSDDSFALDPCIDPSTLCPYCDRPLPPNPTPHLTALLKRAAAHSRSRRDSRPSNPLGRKAPLAVFIGVCQRHRFESVWLPKARKKGWKEDIEWEGLSERVRGFGKVLGEIVNDVVLEYSDDEGTVGDKEERWGPRKKCVFWRELKMQVKMGGLKAVGGVRGQYDTFEKVQPGYYGELGSAVIHQTLYDLFPPTSVPPSQTHPLNPAEFIQRILVPQVGLLLIQDDLKLSPSDALSTMRESVQFGVAMFPHGGDDDGDKDGEMSVVDRMMMEQARRRRKELEIEEKEENEVFEKELQETAEKERNAKTKGKGRGKGKGKGRSRTRGEAKDSATDVEVVGPLQNAPPRPRPRAGQTPPRPRPRPTFHIARDVNRALGGGTTPPSSSNPDAGHHTSGSQALQEMPTLSVSSSSSEVEGMSSRPVRRIDLAKQSGSRTKRRVKTSGRSVDGDALLEWFSTSGSRRRPSRSDAGHVDPNITPTPVRVRSGAVAGGGHNDDTPRARRVNGDHSESHGLSTRLLAFARGHHGAEETEKGDPWRYRMRSPVPHTPDPSPPSSDKLGTTSHAGKSWSWLLSDDSNRGPGTP